MGFLGKVARICVDAAIVFAIICFVPGGYPEGEYKYVEVEPTQPREGPLAPNNILDKAVRLFDNKFVAPEAVAHRGKKNEIFVSMHGGSIVKVLGENFSQFREIVKIGPGCKGIWDERVCGRPLGIRFSKDGSLLVADSYLGIFKVNVDTGEKTRILDPSLPIKGARPLIIDDLDEDSDGNIYWSDASSAFDLLEGVMEALVGPTGRLVMLSPSGQNTVLIDKLHFPNGVQLSPKQDFVLVCETYRRRVLRYWLSGPKAGTSDVFVQGLPGAPDNLRSKPGGGYYINIVAVDDPNAKLNFFEVLAKYPYLRRGVARILYMSKKVIEALCKLYDSYYTNWVPYMFLNTAGLADISSGNRSMVVITDEEGNIVSSLQGTSGTVRFISHTEEVGDRLFFGSPYNHYLGMLTLDAIKRGKGQDPQKTAPKAKEEL